MAGTTTTELDGALARLRTMLDADGYALSSGIVGDRVNLTVEATPAACAECLVSKELFTSIALDAFARAGRPCRPSSST